MEPIDDLSRNLTALLQDIAARRYELDREGQKILLDALRKLQIATEKLNVQLRTLARHKTRPQPQRPTLYLVK